MMNVIRNVLGALIVFLDRLFAPGVEVSRTPAEQTRVDQEVARFQLYQFAGCPFCVKVRRAARRMGIQLAQKDARHDEAAKRELIEGGGEYQTPCLRIAGEDGSLKWLYESSDIIAFLEERFGRSSSKGSAHLLK